MKGIIKIGKITKEQIWTTNKKVSREIELENKSGWVSKHKIHKSKKVYNRRLNSDIFSE
jgi:hypothetical protein